MRTWERKIFGDNLSGTCVHGGTRAEAIRILENNPGQVDLVVSDIMMPKLNGLELRPHFVVQRHAANPRIVNEVVGNSEIIPAACGFALPPESLTNR